jgi:hypothetical protein
MFADMVHAQISSLFLGRRTTGSTTTSTLPSGIRSAATSLTLVAMDEALVEVVTAPNDTDRYPGLGDNKGLLVSPDSTNQ